MKPWPAFFLLLVSLPLMGAEEIPTLRGLSRSHLLEVRGVSGEAATARTPAEWESRKKEALEAFQSVAGPLPGEDQRCPLEMQVDEEADCGSYVRRLIRYQSSPGGQVPAYLCIPKAALDGGAPVPAVLCLHPTDGTVGHGVVVGLGGRENRQYAAELAERGFVTLSPSYPLMAQYQPDLKALGFRSGTMKAVWDNIRGLDLLETLPFVKKEAGFAVIGHSLGGHNGIFTAALEPRLKVVISSCGFDSFLDYMDGRLQGWAQERYMPRMADYFNQPEKVPFDFGELIACLAPRHFLASAPRGDDNFKWESAGRAVESARPVYSLHDASGHLEVKHPECGHDFPDDMRAAAYDLIEQVLGKR